MLTSRSKSILIIATVTFVLGLSVGDQRVGLIGISMILWIGIAWIVFFTRCGLSRELLIGGRRLIDGKTWSQFTMTINTDYQVEFSAV